jgi:hypothetical protein
VSSKPTGRSYLQKNKMSAASNQASPPGKNTVLHAPQSRRSKGHRAPDVHRIPEHIEREALNTGVLEDAEIIAHEPARDTECPARGRDENLADGEERDGNERVERGGEQARTRLF